MEHVKVTLELPTTKNEVIVKSPRRLLIYSPPKTGKTTLASELKDCLLLDLEDGSDFVSALRIKATTYQEIHLICDKIKEEGRPYKYIAIDTITGLEQMVLPLALKLYQRTPMGSTYTGSVLGLANGAGYLYLRNAFDLMLEEIQSAADRLIIFAHIKDKLIGREGKEIAAKDIDLTGKLKQIVCANSDAIGYLYREGNKCQLTFETSEEILCGARPLHLRNKVMTISEQDAKGKTKVFWDQIYID